MTPAPRSAVLIVGSLNADLSVRTPRLPRGGETVHGSPLSVQPGGKSSNQAAAAALLGARVRLIGAVGADANGALLREAASRTGVDTTGVTTVDDIATGTAVIIVDEQAENVIVLSAGANAKLGSEHVTESSVTEASVVCLALEVPMTTVEHVARKGASAGAEVILNLSPFQSVTPELLANTSVLILNEHELHQLTGLPAEAEGWEAVCATLASFGVHRTVVTLGAAGSVVLEPTGVTRLEARRVEAIDTTGCGDAFTGGLAAGLAAGFDLVTAARLGGDAAAYAATGRGAQPSYPSGQHLHEWAGSPLLPRSPRHRGMQPSTPGPRTSMSRKWAPQKDGWEPNISAGQ